MSLITQLNDVMARRGYTQTHVARAIGRSSAVINQYLQGKYQGDITDGEWLFTCSSRLWLAFWGLAWLRH